MVHNLVRKDFAGGNVVAVAEAAREDNYLELIQQTLVLDYPVYVSALSFRPRQFQSVSGFHITVYPGRPQNYRLNFCHLKPSYPSL